MVYDLSSGTKVILEAERIIIQRTGGKAAVKGLFAGRAMGEMFIKTKSVTGAILYGDMLIILGSGFPNVKEFSFSNINDIKQLPNTITGKGDELKELYDRILAIV